MSDPLWAGLPFGCILLAFWWVHGFVRTNSGATVSQMAFTINFLVCLAVLFIASDRKQNEEVIVEASDDTVTQQRVLQSLPEEPDDPDAPYYRVQRWLIGVGILANIPPGIAYYFFGC